MSDPINAGEVHVASNMRQRLPRKHPTPVNKRFLSNTTSAKREHSARRDPTRAGFMSSAESRGGRPPPYIVRP